MSPGVPGVIGHVIFFIVENTLVIQQFVLMCVILFPLYCFLLTYEVGRILYFLQARRLYGKLEVECCNQK